MGRRGLPPYRHQDPPAVKEGEKMSENQVEMIDDEALTDHACAERLMRWYGERHIHYCDDAKFWVEYDGTKWTQVERETIASKYANASIISVRQQLAKQMSEGSSDNVNVDAVVKGYLKKFSAKRNASPLFAMVRLAEGMNPWKMGDFDKIPYLWNCKNGVLDLKTGKLHPHNPAFKIAKISNAAFTGGYSTPDCLWLRFIESVFPNPDTREFVQRLTGAAMAGDPKALEKFVFFLGDGSNGKSIFMGAIFDIAGDYAVSVKSEIYVKGKRQDKGRANPNQASLRGARFAFSDEIDEEGQIDEQEVKALSGSFAITARYLGQNNITFPPTHTSFVCVNDMPGINSTKGIALTRRFKVIPFTQTFSEEDGTADPNLANQLREEQALSDGLYWLFDGCRKWLKCGLNEAPEVKAATNKYFMDYDYIGAFLRECCIFGENLKIHQADLYSAFNTFCLNEYGQTEMESHKSFNSAMKKRYENRRRIYRGISINPVKAEAGNAEAPLKGWHALR